LLDYIIKDAYAPIFGLWTEAALYAPMDLLKQRHHRFCKNELYVEVSQPVWMAADGTK
jgi:hypothetical protein